MKKIILLLIFVASLFTLALMTQAEMLDVDITKLTPEELKAYQQIKMVAEGKKPDFDISRITPEQIDRYGQIGKAFGEAFKECWTTVSSDAEKFAQSDAGKMTMILIAWKIMGSDAIGLLDQFVQYFVGMLFFTISTIIFVYSFKRNCMSKRTVVSKTKKGFFTTHIVYGAAERPIHEGYAGFYALLYIVSVGVSCIIIFAG